MSVFAPFGSKKSRAAQRHKLARVTDDALHEPNHDDRVGMQACRKRATTLKRSKMPLRNDTNRADRSNRTEEKRPMGNVEEPPKGSPWDDPLREAPLVFLDLEMTGLRPQTDRVIEVCAHRVRGDKLEASLTTLVRPDDSAHGNAHVHGITREDLICAPTFGDIARDLLAVLHEGILVAHAAECDVAFLEAELGRVGISQRFPFFLDTLVMSRRAFVFPTHGLEALSAALGIERRRSHRAEDDVLAMREVFQRVVTVLTPESARDLWHVRIGQRHARPAVVEAAQAAVELGKPVRLRYRPAHRGPEDLIFCITGVRTDLDPPRVLGYLHASRSRRELRADRILQIEPLVPSGDKPPK